MISEHSYSNLSTIRFFGLFIAVILSLFSFTACSGNTNESMTYSGPVSSPLISSTDPESDMIPKSGVLRLWAQTPTNYDPLENNQLQWKTMTGLFYEGLYSINEDQKIDNCLAVSDSVSENGLVCEIEIAEDVFFHDGSVFESGDIVYSYKIIKGSDSSPYYPMLENVTDISSVTAHKIKIELKIPDPFFRYRLTFPILPAPENEKDAEFSFFPPGTGPYFLLSNNEGDINARIFDKHRNSDEYSIKKINISILENSMEAMYSLGTDETDMVFLNDELYETYYLRRDVDMYRFPGRTYLFFQMNLSDDSILNEYNRGNMIKNIIYSNNFLEKLRESLIIPSEFPFVMTSGLTHSHNCGHDKYDVKINKYTGTDKSLLIVYSEPDFTEEELIRKLTEELTNAEIKFTVAKLDKTEFENALVNGDYDIVLRKSVTDGTPDPAWLYLAERYPRFTTSDTLTTNVGSLFKLSQEEFYNKYISSYDIAFNDNNCEIIHKLNSEGPFIGIGFKVNALAAGKRIKGDPKPNIFDPFNNLKEVWVWLGY